MRRIISAGLGVAAVASVMLGSAFAAENDRYTSKVLPILRERCNTCHSTENQKGELDLERFGTVEEVKKDPLVWEHVIEQIENNEMPPKKEPQLTVEERTTLLDWVRATLDEVALANAGDPGPVVMRRLSNMEYTYTIRDLTGVESLDPAREFPVDGAAGEGFTNVGGALVMSPSLLTKYLDAAKEIAEHAVLGPEGIRFSAHTSPRDWTDEILERIRGFYAQYTDRGNATAVNLQGVRFATNDGGRLPVEKYIAALLEEKDALREGRKSPGQAANERGLNGKYASLLWSALNKGEAKLLMRNVSEQFRAATPKDAEAVAKEISAWQQSLWRFATVGHIGKKNGPKSWQEITSPLAEQQQIKLKLSPPKDGSDLTLYLVASDAGDGNENDIALWENPRIVASGRPELALRDVQAVMRQLDKHRTDVIASLPQCLAAAAEAMSATERTDPDKLAAKHGVNREILAGWLDYLGIGSAGEAKLGPLLTKKIDGTPDYNFIKGWVGERDLSVLANSSDAQVRIPGIMKPHSVATHPSPQMASVIAWRSPVNGKVRISGSIVDVHPECGNGVTWALEVRRGQTRERLAGGLSKGGEVVLMGQFDEVRVLEGDAVAVIIGPRDGDHTCDMTGVDLTLHDGTREWDLAKDVSPNILAGNPHADRHGNRKVWHFFGEPATSEQVAKVPAGSVLAKWRNASSDAERAKLAAELQALLKTAREAVPAGSPDAALRQQLLSSTGPLLSAAMRTVTAQANDTAGSSSAYGLDPALFGKHPNGSAVDARSLCVQAPKVVEVRLPAELMEGAEFVVTGKLASAEGSVQMQVLTTKPKKVAGVAASPTEPTMVDGQWYENNLRTKHSVPIIAKHGGAAWQRFEEAFAEFRSLFPLALCYTKIVPVDEVVTLTLFYREDDQLKRLMLDEKQSAMLDRMWDELRFVSEYPLKQVDVFDQLWQYATQDADPSAFEPLREPIKREAAEFRRWVSEAEPKHVESVLEFAGRAWRRPLNEAEKEELRALYRKLRTQELPHANAVRMLIARVLVAPAFLYRGELPGPGAEPVLVSELELATRLSYFLWASAPDEELMRHAREGRLRDPAVLSAQARRMLKDARVRRLATEFGCQWLHVRDIETLDEKSERHFPTFTSVRGAMQEEVVQFFMDLFREDRSVLGLLDADFTFVNGELAKHYGFEVKGDGWQRVDGVRAKGRGGILGFASTLAKHAGASRTSPILRGNWVTEVVLGEKLPRPPKGVPVLPDEAPAGLTERQLIERHSSDPNCAGCHRRIDPYGFALEGFDPIGRARTKDTAGLTIDTKTTLPDGTEVDGIEGVRTYLMTKRSDDFLRQFCRKLIGYALGRSLQLSDKPLLESMLAELKANDHRVSAAIDLIVRSPQFQRVRGRDYITTSN